MSGVEEEVTKSCYGELGQLLRAVLTPSAGKMWKLRKLKQDQGGQKKTKIKP